MQKIKLLPQQEILKIAAGQVIDRPANVVKELMENAIDAEAKNISVYVEDGGKNLVRVADDGHGMSRQDAKLCFTKHATSKICHIKDLETIHTFGFRGEALASMSAVSKITLLTKSQDSQNGFKLELENGKFTTEKEVPLDNGTDLKIKNLFYNTPARQKFLKKRETENRHITQLFQAFCLSHLNIGFKLFIDGKKTVHCPATSSITKRVAQIWGHDFAKNLVTIEIDKQGSKPFVYGAVTNHQYFRYDRNNIFLFVNNRWVHNYEIQSALLKGYINVLPPARYPAAFVFVEIDPELVDVNIHPRKEEVKFLHPRMVTTKLQSKVKKALEGHLSSQIGKNVILKPETSHFAPSNKEFTPFNFDPFAGNTSNYSKTETPTPQLNEPEQKQTTAMTIGEEKSQTQIIQQTYDIIGQFKKTYILIEKPDGLFFVDQHAAHERVLYQIFSKRFEDVAMVKLLFPQFITVKEDELNLLEQHLHIFRKNGIDVEIFGKNQLKIQATPVHVKNINFQELAKEVISWIKEFQALDKQDFFKKINEKMHAQMACKAAIKAGDVLTIEQMEKLLYNLQNTQNRFACPHGRPTGWILTTYEIEKKFKRKC